LQKSIYAKGSAQNNIQKERPTSFSRGEACCFDDDAANFITLLDTPVGLRKRIWGSLFIRYPAKAYGGVMNTLYLIILAGFIAVAYGIITRAALMKSSTGNERMRFKKARKLI